MTKEEKSAYNKEYVEKRGGKAWRSAKWAEYIKRPGVADSLKARSRARSATATGRAKQAEIRKRYYAKTDKKLILAKDKIRRDTDPNFKIAGLIRHRIWKCIKRESKRSKSLQLLGCTVAEFRAYIEKLFLPGMTWENHGPHTWHLDHIKPCASFDMTTEEGQRVCFHYTNYQPLAAMDN